MPRLEQFCTRCKPPTLGCDCLAKKKPRWYITWTVLLLSWWSSRWCYEACSLFIWHFIVQLSWIRSRGWSIWMLEHSTLLMAFYATQAVTFEASMSFLWFSLSFHIKLGCCGLQFLLNRSRSIFSIRLHSISWSSLHLSCQSGIRLPILPVVSPFFLLHLHT